MSKKITIRNLADAILATGVVSTKKDAKTAALAAVGSMRDGLTAGRDIMLSKFGAFDIKPVAERTHKVPVSGVSVTVPAHNRVKFTASPALVANV